jgi:hypothetical protein
MNTARISVELIDGSRKFPVDWVTRVRMPNTEDKNLTTYWLDIKPKRPFSSGRESTHQVTEESWEAAKAIHGLISPEDLEGLTRLLVFAGAEPTGEEYDEEYGLEE